MQQVTSVFYLPRSDERRKLWMSYLVPTNSTLLLLTKEQLTTMVVCEKHFERRHFDAHGRRLQSSYPTLFSEAEIARGEPLPTTGDESNLTDQHNYCKGCIEDDVSDSERDTDSDSKLVILKPDVVADRDCHEHAYCQTATTDKTVSLLETVAVQKHKDILQDITYESMGEPSTSTQQAKVSLIVQRKQAGTCLPTPQLNMQNLSEESIHDNKVVDFESIPVDSTAEKYLYFLNNADKPLSYRISLMYVLNNIDQVFKVDFQNTLANPGGSAVLKIVFRPNVVWQKFTEYYIVDDTGGGVCRLTVTGKCFGPVVTLSRKNIKFRISKHVSVKTTEDIDISNQTSVDITYQWFIPTSKQEFFQITTGNCGLVRAREKISARLVFTGTALGVYTAEIVFLVLNQEPLFVHVVAAVVLPGNPMYDVDNHFFERRFHSIPRPAHLMENSLNRLSYIPTASIFERYLDFETGSSTDMTKNISQTLSVTNHGDDVGFIQWMADSDNVFLIDPLSSEIPPEESRLFTIRFRPKSENEVYGYLLCGDYQQRVSSDGGAVKHKHTWFRIPCIGNTWAPCTEWQVEWGCTTEVVLPPTVPLRTAFSNFMLSNKLEVPMCFKFEAPSGTNFAVMPMCGLVAGRGWQIVNVALEPKAPGDYVETWDLIINTSQRVRICVSGSAEVSQVDVMSHGYNPDAHALFEFPPTITGCTNYCTAYFHNLTRMAMHVRVLCNVDWLGADNCGTFEMRPKEIKKYLWWFFPRTPNKVYDTTITCSIICLINGRPIGEPQDVLIHIFGFSEFPDLRVLPKTSNLHDIPIPETVRHTVTLYNFGTCFFTSKLYYEINGMDDDWSGDKFEIDPAVELEFQNSLKPQEHCQITFAVTPDSVGSRQINIKYTVLFRTEYDEIEEIQPIKKTICTIWYDGIHPTIKVKRTISVSCPVILSDHCVWNLTNVDELNKTFVDCRPNKPLYVTIYAPDLCLRSGTVELIFVLGCVYAVPVAWSLRREKICECPMLEHERALSHYEMRHTCVHRPLVELSPTNGIVSKETPCLLHLKFNYAIEGQNQLRYVMTMPNHRVVNININICAHLNTKGILTPLRRPREDELEYLAVLNCGRVPINNLDPVIRLSWLYNPTDVFTTWRLLRGNTVAPESVIRCLLYFAEVPPLGKLAVPFAFLPTEMIDYEVVFYCSFGYDTVKILVKGQGGLPNCVETRLDIPSYVERSIRSTYRNEVVYISSQHITVPIIPTHSLSRDIISICNDTDHVMRFIWLPERISNVVNVVMTPCWGVIQPKSSEWITMTVYTLQEPATFTTAVACELLDLTERRRYQKNEFLRRNKIEKCNQEFTIIEEGLFHPGINDSPPYVLDIEKPQPSYLAITVSVSSKGQRDGFLRMTLKQMWEQIPPYDLLSSDLADYSEPGGRTAPGGGNNMTMADILRVIDGILWDALHSKMFKYQIKYYAQEEIPTYMKLMKKVENETKPKLSRRVTSGICDAIVNKAVFHVYGLNIKHDEQAILEAEE